MTFAYSGLLGVYFTLLFTKRGSAVSVIAALATGFVAIALQQSYIVDVLGLPAAWKSWPSPTSSASAPRSPSRPVCSATGKPGRRLMRAGRAGRPGRGHRRLAALDRPVVRDMDPAARRGPGGAEGGVDRVEPDAGEIGARVRRPRRRGRHHAHAGHLDEPVGHRAARLRRGEGGQPLAFALQLDREFVLGEAVRERAAQFLLGDAKSPTLPTSEPGSPRPLHGARPGRLRPRHRG